MVLGIFNQTTAHSTSGKLTFGLLAAIWSASVGISALQDATNAVCKIIERRSYVKARFQAILLTLLLLCTLTLCLASMFAVDFVSAWLHHQMRSMAAALEIRFDQMATMAFICQEVWR
jgi:membrane protein